MGKSRRFSIEHCLSSTCCTWEPRYFASSAKITLHDFGRNLSLTSPSRPSRSMASEMKEHIMIDAATCSLRGSHTTSLTTLSSMTCEYNAAVDRLSGEHVKVTNQSDKATCLAKLFQLKEF